MTETKASPPGEPDPIDLSRIVGYVTPDPVVMLNRQLIQRRAIGLAMSIWSALVLFTLILFVVTGSLFAWLLGYMVTVPYLLVCYKYRDVSAYVDELALYCRQDGC